MEALIKGAVGPYRAQSGVETPIRLGSDSETIVQPLHGRYYEQGIRGNTYAGANQAAQAISVALATTYTGLMLFNPVGSGKVLSLNKMKFALSVAPAAIATIGLIGGFAATGGVTAQTTKITPQSSLIGNSSTGAGIVLSAATIVTPTWIFQLLDGFTAAALPSPSVPIDLEGSFQILPGGFIGIGALTAVTGLGAFVWEEIAL